MALVNYSRYMFYPGGGLAQNAAVDVFLLGSNVRPSLFSDAEGTQPKEPVTDGDGLLSFYTGPGVYGVGFAGELFVMEVDVSQTEPVKPGVVTFVQTSPSSVWTVMHAFNGEPTVEVDFTSSAVPFTVAYTDSNNLTITFTQPSTGTATLRR